MQVNITFRHLEPTEALKSHVRGRVEHVQRYFDRPTEAHAVLHVENLHHHAEITLKAGRYLLRGTARSPELYASIDAAAEMAPLVAGESAPPDTAQAEQAQPAPETPPPPAKPKRPKRPPGTRRDVDLTPYTSRPDEQGGAVVKKYPVWLVPAIPGGALLLSWLTVVLVSFLHARAVAGAIGGY